MKTSLASQSPFDSMAIREGGRELWSARDLMPKLGYRKWERAPAVLERAMASCQNSGHDPAEHFRGASKPSKGGNGAVQMVEDFHLTRYAAYLVAMNGDPRKPEIAAAQTYFAIKTREAETGAAPSTHAVVDARYAPPTPVGGPSSRGEVQQAEMMDGSGVPLDPTLALLEVIKQQYLKTAEHDRRITAIEERQSAAADAMSALPAPTVSAPDLTDADRCRQMVESIASASGRGFRDIWHDAYREYDLRMRVCVQKRVEGFNKERRPKDHVSKLEWVCRYGSIGALYSILCQMRDKVTAALAG